MTDDEMRAAAADLVFEVMGLEMPVPTNPTPSGGSGRYWRIDGDFYHDNDEPLHLALAYFWDLWRRKQVKRLVAERGLPPELVELAWDALPYESVPFRLGWERWRALREAACRRRSDVPPTAPGTGSRSRTAGRGRAAPSSRSRRAPASGRPGAPARPGRARGWRGRAAAGGGSRSPRRARCSATPAPPR